MKYSNSIEYNISTKFDSSGITKLKSELAQVELKLQNMGNKNQLFKFDEYRSQIQGLGDALTEAFNPSLGIINLQQFRAALKENQVTAQGLRDAFKAAGADGQVAFNNLIGQIGRLDTGIKRTSSAVDKMFTTFSNTFRWGLVSSFWSQFLNAIHSSVEYTKELDDSLTQIMLVTDYSRDSMNEYAKAANEAAKAVGQTTVGMTNASLIFAQQGYGLDQSQRLATLSAKLANASQQDTAATSDQITAYMNAYGLQDDMEALSQAMDNWALIANISAADVEEIALASQRAASMANAVGVSGEALAAQIATIESVTREAPEQIGNGLKTLYARFSDLQLGKEDEDGIGLGKVTSTLQSIGVQVLDSLGNVRNMDDIMEDLMAIWQDLDDTTQEAVAQTLAGKHQVNRFTALMDNADMYQEYLGATGETASGTLEQMNQEYMDSLQGRMATLQATLEGLFNDVFTTDMIYPLIDALTKLAKAIDTLFKSVGGGPTVILGLASAFTKLFSNSIARSITDTNLNNALQKQRVLNFEDKAATLAYLGSTNPNPNNTNSQAILNYAQQINSMSGSFNVEQMNRFNEILQEMVVNANAAAKADGELKTQLEGLNAVSNILFGQGTESFIDEAGAVNATALIESLKGKTEAFKDSLSFIKTTQTDLGDLSESTTRLLNNIQKGLESGNVDIEEYKSNVEDLRFVLNLLKTALPQDKVKELSALFDEAEINTEDWATDSLPKLISQLKGAQLNIIKVAEGLKEFAKANKDLTPEQLEQYLQKLEELAAKAKIAQGAATGANKLGETTIDVAKQQEFTKSIIDTVGAIGQLTFAWQSLSNLPAIWHNEDINTGEKLQQTITNLTMSLPTLTKSFQQLSKIDSLSKLIKARKNLTIAEENAKKANDALIEAQNNLNIAQAYGEKNAINLRSLNEQVTEATKAQTKAEEGLTKASKENAIATEEVAAAHVTLRIAVLAAAAVIAIAISAISAHMESLRREVKNSGEAFNEAFEKTQIDTSKFDELYEEYKKTGEASDELREAGITLGEQLDITGAKAYAASDNFNKLAEEIENAKIASEEFAQEQADKLLVDTNVASEDFTQWWQMQNLPLLTPGVGIAGGAGGPRITDRLSSYDTGEPEWEEWESGSAIEKYNMALEAIRRLSELETQFDEEGNTFLANVARKRKQNWEDTLDNLFSDFPDMIENMAELTLSNLSEKDFEGMGADQIIETLLDPNGDYSWIAAEYETLGAQYGPEAAEKFLDGVLSQVNPQEWADKELESLIEQAQNSRRIIGTYANGESEYGGGYWDQFNNLLNFGDTNGLSSKNIVDIAELINWDSPNLDQELANLLERMRVSVKGGLSINDFISIEQAGGAEEYLKNISSSDEETVSNEDLQNAALTLYNNNDSMSQYANDLELVPPLIAEIAEAQLRYNAAVETSAQNMEKWNQTFDDIENHNENLEDVADTMKDLRDTYSDFLDLSEDVSDEFISNRKNLERLERAINGDTEAYNELAEAAAEDITMHLGLDEDDVEDAIDTVKSIYDILNSDEYEALKAGDLIDLDSFPDLWPLLQQYVSYLSSLGLSVDEIRQKIMELFHIDIPEDAFAGPEAAVANSAGKVAGTVDQAVSNIKQNVATVPSTVKKNLSFAQKTKIKSLKSKKQDTVSYTNLQAVAIPHSKEVTYPVGNGDGVEGKTFTATYYDLKYIPITKSVPQIKESTGQSIESEVETGEGASGNVSLMDLGNGSGQFGGEGVRTTSPGGGFTPTGSYSPSSGGGGGSCFIAGTLVSLQNSFKNIEDIQIGDIVLSYNEEKHQNEYSRVLQTMIHNTTEEIYDLYIEDEILSVTGIHRFYIRRKHDIEWIMASELNVGDYVLFADGDWHVISNINIKIQTTIVYNFEVSDNHNYYVGRNQILAHNKGGGGGGGSAKTIEKKEKEKHEKDYYEEYDSQLDKLKETLSGIEKENDKLIGDKARANQAKQIDLLNKEVVLQEKKLEILKNQEIPDTKNKLNESIKELQDILSKYGLNLNMPELKYDEDGIISNFEDISKKLDDKYNELVDKQWAISNAGNEEANKEITDALSKVKKEKDSIKSYIQTLNDLQKKQVEWTNAVQESKDAITDLNIELYKTSMEAINNLNDLNEKWAEFQGFLTGMSSDSPFRKLTVDLLKLNTSFEIGREDAEKYYQEIINGKLAAQDATDDIAEKEAIQASINYFTGLKEGLTDDRLKNGLLGLATTDLEQLEKWYKNDPTAGENPFGDNQKALAEAYQEGYERVLELSQDWQDLQEDIVDTVIDGFDEIADKQDRQLEKYERLAEELENLADIYALSYGDESYKALSDINKRQAETLKAQLGQYVNIYKYWQKKYQEALDTGNEELANSIEDRMNDVQDEMRDTAQESAETFVEAYENAIDAAVQQMYNATIREDNLDHINQNWEWNKKIVDNYRDEVEKTFEIEQLRSKYNDLLNDAQGSSLATQNKIRKQMQEQLDLLKNQESMSEYDVELANSKLLILQKQIALEDAQQNKNQMQLRRDSQGNYRYVYRANQNDIAKARQEYMQAVQDAYELTKEQRQKTAEELGNTLKDYASQWADLNKNMNLTEEKRIKQSRELTEKFLNYMKHLNEDLADSQLGMSDVLNFMVKNGTADIAAAAQEMLGQLFDDQGNLIENTDIAWWDFGNNLAKKLFPYIQDATSTMNDTLKTEAEELRNKLTGPDGVITDVKKALIDEETGLRPALEDAANAITGENGLNNAMDSLTDSFKNQNEKLTEGMNNIKKYTEELAAAVDWLSKAQEAINDLQKINTDNLVYETKAPLPEDAKPAEEKPTSTSTSTMESATTKKTFPNGSIAGYKGSYYGNSWGGGGSGNSLSGQANKIRISSFSRGSGYGSYNIHIETLDGGDLGWIKEDQLFDTGGYTGEWGKDGRLAVLHQKELVLNAQDTRNILSAVDIVRQMTSTLGSALTNYSSNGMKANFMNSAFGGTVDQRVEIKAEFPNVKDSFEIETALTNLADTAYQYAHRKI